MLSVKKGVSVSLLLRLRGHTEQNGVFALQDNSGNDVNLGFLAYSRSPKLDSSRCESSGNPYDFDKGLMSIVK